MGEQNNYFMFFKSYFEAMEELPKRHRFQFLLALIKYSLYGEEIELDKTVKGMFKLCKPTIDAGLRRDAERKKGGETTKKKWEEKKGAAVATAKVEKDFEVENVDEIDVEKVVEREVGVLNNCSDANEHFVNTHPLNPPTGDTKYEEMKEECLRKFAAAEPLSKMLKESGLKARAKMAAGKWLAHKDWAIGEEEWNALLSLFVDAEAKFGGEAIGKLVSTCIANGWKNIVWERISK